METPYDSSDSSESDNETRALGSRKEALGAKLRGMCGLCRQRTGEVQCCRYQEVAHRPRRHPKECVLCEQCARSDSVRRMLKEILDGSRMCPLCSENQVVDLHLILSNLGSKRTHAPRATRHRRWPSAPGSDRSGDAAREEGKADRRPVSAVGCSDAPGNELHHRIDMGNVLNPPVLVDLCRKYAAFHFDRRGFMRQGLLSAGDDGRGLHKLDRFLGNAMVRKLSRDTESDRLGRPRRSFSDSLKADVDTSPGLQPLFDSFLAVHAAPSLCTPRARLCHCLFASEGMHPAMCDVALAIILLLVRPVHMQARYVKATGGTVFVSKGAAQAGLDAVFEKSALWRLDQLVTMCRERGLPLQAWSDKAREALLAEVHSKCQPAIGTTLGSAKVNSNMAIVDVDVVALAWVEQWNKERARLAEAVNSFDNHERKEAERREREEKARVRQLSRQPLSRKEYLRLLRLWKLHGVDDAPTVAVEEGAVQRFRLDEDMQVAIQHLRSAVEERRVAVWRSWTHWHWDDDYFFGGLQVQEDADEDGDDLAGVLEVGVGRKAWEGSIQVDLQDCASMDSLSTHESDQDERANRIDWLLDEADSSDDESPLPRLRGVVGSGGGEDVCEGKHS